MEEELQFSGNENINSYIERFEEMLKKDEQYFFDVDEFEDIIDFYTYKNNHKRANQAVALAISQHPASIEILIKKAGVLADSNKPQKALTVLSDIEAIEPGNVDVFMLRGDIYSRLREHEKALKCYKRAAAGSEELDEVYMYIAYEYQNLDDNEKALEFLKKSLEENQPVKLSTILPTAM